MFAATEHVVTSQVRDFVNCERMKSLSDREWKFRLAGYGYDLRKEPDCLKLVTLPHGVEVCDLPLERPVN